MTLQLKDTVNPRYRAGQATNFIPPFNSPNLLNASWTASSFHTILATAQVNCTQPPGTGTSRLPLRPSPQFLQARFLTYLCTSKHKTQQHLPCFIITVRNRTMTLEHGLIRTWRLPLFSALLILLRASARTFMRTIMAVQGRQEFYHHCQHQQGPNHSTSSFFCLCHD